MPNLKEIIEEHLKNDPKATQIDLSEYEYDEDVDAEDLEYLFENKTLTDVIGLKDKLSPSDQDRFTHWIKGNKTLYQQDPGMFRAISGEYDEQTGSGPNMEDLDQPKLIVDRRGGQVSLSPLKVLKTFLGDDTGGDTSKTPRNDLTESRLEGILDRIESNDGKREMLEKALEYLDTNETLFAPEAESIKEAQIELISNKLQALSPKLGR